MMGFLSSSKALLSGLAHQTSFIRNNSYLGNLRAFEGAVKSYKRLGRGPASGKGKTSGRGHKGQKARGKVPFWLEGGQTPYYKLFPITGFKRPHKKIFNEINLARIQDFWNTGRIPLQGGDTLTIAVMKECGLISGSLKDGVKLLGRGYGTYNVPLNVEASKASETVVQAIRNTGHKYTSIYHSKLGLLAHVYPDRLLFKKGYVPLQARPTHKRDIAYYSNSAKGGYLLDDRSILLDYIGKSSEQKTAVKKSAIDYSLESARTKSYPEFSESKIVSLSSLEI